MTTNYWLLKSEPHTFSIDDLIKAPNQSTRWDGVRNYQARNYIRDKMKVNDFCFFYHSSCPVPAIVGIVEITQPCHIDETALNPKSEYFDPQSTPQNPRWFQVTVTFKQKFEKPITLTELKNNPNLKHIPLVQRGSRLSIMPLSHQDWQCILNMTKRT